MGEALRGPLRRFRDSWYWEVWNEPNIKYWNGTVDQFFQLHDYAIANVRRALLTARVGGFETAGGPGGNYLGNFIEHVLHGTNYATGKIGSPLDFLSFHAKGSLVFINSSCHVGGGYIRMNLAPQLQNVNDSFALFASYPQIKDKPIVMSEYDPDSCRACLTPQYGYRNGLLYPSYNAASFVRAFDLACTRGLSCLGIHSETKLSERMPS
jgi:xylan 1,4-beta-xylosidase